LLHDDGAGSHPITMAYVANFEFDQIASTQLAVEPQVKHGWGVLVDFSCPVARIIPEELAYDYEKWGDPTNETRARYTTTVYNFEVEDWHTYFVGRMGVWVHNTNCLEATLEVAPGKGDIDQLLTGVLQVGSQAHKFKTLSRADLNDFLRKNPNAKQGVAVVKMDGAGKYDKFELGADDLPNGLKFEDEGLGRLIDKSTGTRYEYAVLIDPSSWSGQSLGTNLASRLSQARYVKLENSYFTKNGTRVFVDRKFDTTSMSNAALKYKPLDQLFRLALAAKSNDTGGRRASGVRAYALTHDAGRRYCFAA
jgi:hypothetical protein